MSRYEIHNFYCMSCGNSIPLPRKLSKQKESMHRKKLYCPFCKTEANMVEVRSFEDKEKFMQAFTNGDFKEELQTSINFIKGSI